MVDFLMISTRSAKNGVIEIRPKFIIKKSSDLMIRGGDFYAIWVEERGLWSTDEQDAIQIIDRELDIYAEKNRKNFEGNIKVMHLWDSETGMIDHWHKYCQKHMRDSFHMLDEKLIFSNYATKKDDYASKRLPYPLEDGDTSAYDKLMSVLYSEEERKKIEWAIGSIVCGDSKKLQKFVVLYGAAGTGKSTVLNIIQQLFEGYYSVFDAKALGSSNNSFALEAFKTNPLVAIQHDGDLSRIEDNTRLNSLVAHEMMTVNEKFKSTYANKFKSFLFMGTNKPVRITDAKSGLIRRLIDVSPTGNRVPTKEYKILMKQISFELGAIAMKCRDVYLDQPDIYDNYIPTNMMEASNTFYNFVIDSYDIFKRNDGTTLKAAWELYKVYCDEAKVTYALPKMIFKEELKNYFEGCIDRYTMDDGTRVRNYYTGFKSYRFEEEDRPEEKPKRYLIEFKRLKSIFDKLCKDCPAQYASENETPLKRWSEVDTKLSDIDTSRLHYVKVPKEHIVIDFDIPDENGNKSFEKNLEEASKWPPTYAELSKSGKGIHLHYIYTGDPMNLERIYKEHVEIKVAAGNSSLRRKLSLCNDLPINTISSGLPVKEEKKIFNQKAIKSEKGLRSMILRNLDKEFGSTKVSINFIYDILEDAYKSGLNYDVSDLKSSVMAFAAHSTNQSDYCMKLVRKMKFKSEDISENKESEDHSSYTFYDVEVFPNLFLVNWATVTKEKIEELIKLISLKEKKPGELDEWLLRNIKVNRMINPKPENTEWLCKFNLIGFNCRRYDNHMLYARTMGYSEEELYRLSQKIIGGKNGCFFSEAYNWSFTDIYDFSSKKQSLKKFEIELGITHKELGLKWDEPVPKKDWLKVAEYCDNDVRATVATFAARHGDFVARQILADVAGMTVNDTTNTLTTRIIFGKNRHPQEQFNYRNMGELSRNDIFPEGYDEFTRFNKAGFPIFPGYKFEKGVSTYRGEEVGEGGYVYAEPGMYTNVALLDIASMHPSSTVAENLFGDIYTKKFSELLQARIAIKHKDFDKARKMLDGKLEKYLNDESVAKDLAQALKIAINSVYGLTSAKFENPARDPRNIDNIVAKRGSLFMINLKHEVQKRGFTVVHIKTDSIKIANANKEIINFVIEYGKLYGYSFEHEATYDRICLVNNAVYVARYDDGEWTATGTQFQVPYVFKTLFSKEDIQFEDLCETKSVTSAIYLDMNENLVDVSEEEKELKKLVKKYKDEQGITIDINDLPSKYEEVNYYAEKIALGHNYKFVGRVGLFCPIKKGKGGGILLRENPTGVSRYAAVTGTDGYRWLEAEDVKRLDKFDDIDRSYYDKLVTDAVNDISEFGDFEWFVSDDRPPWELPCGKTGSESCLSCPHYHVSAYDLDCDLGYDISNLILPDGSRFAHIGELPFK